MDATYLLPFSVRTHEDRVRLAELLVQVGNAILHGEARSANVSLTHRASEVADIRADECTPLVRVPSSSSDVEINVSVTLADGAYLKIPLPQCETLSGPYRCVLDLGHAGPCESYDGAGDAVVLG